MMRKAYAVVVAGLTLVVTSFAAAAVKQYTNAEFGFSISVP